MSESVLEQTVFERIGGDYLSRRIGIISGKEPDTAIVRLSDGSTLCVPRTPMKRIYSRFNLHQCPILQDQTLTFLPSVAARLVTLALLLSGFALSILTIVLNLPISFYFGAGLLLAISVASMAAWPESLIFRIDENSSLIRLQKTHVRRRKTHLMFAQSEIAAIQILAFELGDAWTVMVTSYEVNLVFSSPYRIRVWLTSCPNAELARRTAAQLAAFLNVPVLHHTYTP